MYNTSGLSLQAVAKAVDGEIRGVEVLAPGPGHSKKDRSMSIKLSRTAPDGFVCSSFSGDNPLACKDYVRERLNLPPWKPACDNNVSGDFALRGLGEPSAVWRYQYADGTEAGVVARYHAPQGKTIRPWVKSGSGWTSKAMPEPRPLYRLQEILTRPTDRVIVCEGEKSSDAAAKLFPKYVMTTSAGGSKAASKTDWSTLRGRNVIIWPDNDAPGEVYAKDVARLARAAGAASVYTVQIPQNWPQKYDLADPLPKGITIEMIAEMLNNYSHAASFNDSPMPLVREMPRAEAYPVDALGLVLGGMARALHSEVVRAPLALCGTAVLAAAALAVQGHADIRLPTWNTVPTSLFFLTIAASGERKSSCDAYALKPVREREEELRVDYELALSSWRNRHDAWTAEREKIKKDRKLTVSAKRDELENLGPEPPRPANPLLTLSEPTIEGAIRHWSQGYPSTGIFTTEGGQFIGGHGFNDDAKVRTAGAFNKLWDGAPLERVRASGEAVILPGRRVSIHLQAQPDVALKMISDRTLIDIGLMARFLVANPESTMGTRERRTVSPENELAMDEYSARMRSILRHPLPMAEGRPYELVPRCMHLSPNAVELWDEFSNFIEAQLGMNGDLRQISGLANKCPEHAARIAAVMTLFDDLDASEIGLDCLQRGLDLIQYHMSEALRLLGVARVNAELSDAQILLDWLHGWIDPHTKARATHVSIRAIYTYGPAPIRDAETARKLVDKLVAHGWLKPANDGALVAGRSSKLAWEITQGGCET